MNKEKGGFSRPLVLTVAVLLAAVAVIYAVMQERTQKNNSAQESVQADTGEAVVTVALPDLETEKPEVDSSKEIVNVVLLSDVPIADFSFSLN